MRRHQKRIYRLALHLLRDAAEAEDATQETFVRAYGALDRFDGRSEAFTWIYRISGEPLAEHDSRASLGAKQVQRRPAL